MIGLNRWTESRYMRDDPQLPLIIRDKRETKGFLFLEQVTFQEMASS